MQNWGHGWNVLFIYFNSLAYSMASVGNYSSVTDPRRCYDWLQFRSIQNANEENGRWSPFLFVSECISVSRVIRCLKVGIYMSSKCLTYLNGVCSSRVLLYKSAFIISVEFLHNMPAYTVVPAFMFGYRVSANGYRCYPTVNVSPFCTSVTFCLRTS